jgi:hypothetical protein
MSERYTTQITKEWMRARMSVRSAKEQLVRAEEEMKKIGHELGKRLAPNDMKEGETIGLWNRIDDHDERCFMVTLVKGCEYSTALRGECRKIEGK